MQVLNFYSTIFADQLKRGRKTATIRLGDKSHKYKKNQAVLVTIGYQHSPREKIFEAVIDQVEVKRVKDLTPRDIERSCINMVRGSHHVGAYLPTQLGASRPTPELSQYRTPVEGLYLCGSSSHSGGSVSGSPGYNCANTLAEDLELKRWWTPVPSPSWAE